jgi:hypothetical protein
MGGHARAHERFLQEATLLPPLNETCDSPLMGGRTVESISVYVPSGSGVHVPIESSPRIDPGADHETMAWLFRNWLAWLDEFHAFSESHSVCPGYLPPAQSRQYMRVIHHQNEALADVHATHQNRKH